MFHLNILIPMFPQPIQTVCEPVQKTIKGSPHYFPFKNDILIV